MAGRPKHRARVAKALAEGKAPPANPHARNPALSVEHAEERARLERLIRPPSGFTSGRCTEKTGAGKACPNSAVWGLEVCVRHGGLDPKRQEELRERIGAMVEYLDPRKLLIRGHQILDAHMGMLMDDAGKFLPVRDWPPEVLPAIRSVKVLNWNADPNDGKTESVVEVTFHPQERYQELMMREAGQLLDKLEVSGTVRHDHAVAQEFVEALQDGLARAASAARADPHVCPHCHRSLDPEQLPEARPVETIYSGRGSGFPP